MFNKCFSIIKLTLSNLGPTSVLEEDTKSENTFKCKSQTGILKT